jgi:[acyl-carrier-protein] S-malonyltransferase
VRCLVEQVTGTVRWRECVLYLVNHGVDRLLELGSGKVLTGLAKRIAKETSAVAIGSPDDVAAFKV